MASCSSSISIHKSAKSDTQRSKSCDTVCTSNSSCYLQKRKPVNPLMYSLRPSYAKSSGSSVRQRVMSAKLLKLRTIQNQLNDANYHLSELTKENQILKNLQKRQDKALSKYESTSADLPRLLHSHEEQLRVISEKNKAHRKTIRELNDLLKIKEEELSKAHEKLVHFEKLNRDKRLLDREKMAEQIENLTLKLSKSDDQVSTLTRKLLLESKTSKQRLNSEMIKHKQCQKELSQALTEIERLSSLLEAKENVVHPRSQRFSRMGQRQSMSMVTLGAYHRNRSKSSDKLSTIDDAEAVGTKTPVTDIKLEPIKCRLEDISTSKANGILSVPSEAIRNRLSSGSTKSRDSEEMSNGMNNHSSGSEVSLNGHDSIASSEAKPDKRDNVKSRSSSGDRLDRLTEDLDVAIQKATENTSSEFDKKLGEYCSTVLTNVRECSDRIEVHKKNLKISIDDTDSLIDTFQKTQKMESKLKSSLMSFGNDDLFNDLLSEEGKHQKKIKDRNGNISKKDQLVNFEDKRKLLATLKAIDNGESFESIGDTPTYKSNNAISQLLTDVSK